MLTGWMTGCLITLWTENGVRYVGHIGTSAQYPDVNALVKGNFAKAMPMHTIGFNPVGAWPFNELMMRQNRFKSGPEPRIVGLVTSLDQFYSILLFQRPPTGGDQWCVAGIRRVEPMDRAAVLQKLNGN